MREHALTTVITDGAAICKAMQRKLQEKMTHLQSLVCVAHSLGLRLNEISNIAPFKQIIRKVEAVRVFIKSHQNVLKALRDVGEQAPSVLRRARTCTRVPEFECIPTAEQPTVSSLCLKYSFSCSP
jgi:hypothetical protein